MSKVFRDSVPQRGAVVLHLHRATHVSPLAADDEFVEPHMDPPGCNGSCHQGRPCDCVTDLADMGSPIGARPQEISAWSVMAVLLTLLIAGAALWARLS